MRFTSLENFEKVSETENRFSSYLLAGTEYYQRNRLRQHLVDCFSKRSGLELVMFQGNDLVPGELKKTTSEGSLFSTGKLVIISHVDRAGSEVKKEILEFAVKKSNTDIFLTITDKTTIKKGFLAKLTDLAATFVCYDPFERDMQKWCRKLCMEEGLSLTGDVCNLIVDYSAGSLKYLAGSIEKLVLFFGEHSAPSIDEVSRVVSTTSKTDIFILSDALMSGDTGKSLSAFWKMMYSGEDIVGIIAFLFRQWEKLQIVKNHVKAGNNRKVISIKTGLRGLMLDRIISSAERKSESDADEIAEAFARADEGAKTGENPFVVAANLVFVLTSGVV